MAYTKGQKALLQAIGNSTTKEDTFKERYLAMQIKLGIVDIAPDPYPCPETGYCMKDHVATEGLMDALSSFANLALKYLGDGLMTLADRTFSSIRTTAEKRFMNYASMMTAWRARVWKNSREIDGRKFDAYVVNVVPHAVMVKRIQAVEAVHKALSNIGGIYNAPVRKNSDDWTTPECEKAITALGNVGIDASSLDMLSTMSKQYDRARKKQPLYLHGYTPKRILDIMTRCEKLAEYGDASYISKFEETYLKHTDTLEDKEQDTTMKRLGEDLSEKELKNLDEDEHENRIRAARLWWLAHFLKAAYQVTSDILADVEVLMKATERTLADEEEE